MGLLGAIRATARCRLPRVRSALARFWRPLFIVCGNDLRACTRQRGAGVPNVLAHRTNGGLGVAVADRAVDLGVLFESPAKAPGSTCCGGDEKTNLAADELADARG